MKKDIFDKNTEWMKRTYDSLIQSRLYRGRIKRKGDGFNKHHIIPKCMGGKDKKENYVLLTFREHIIAHMLLARIYPNNIELSYAFLRMIQSSHSDRKENIYKTRNGKTVAFSTRYLQELRDKSIKYLSELNTGTKATKETKEKLSNSHLGIRYSEEHKSNLSKIRKGKYKKSNITVIDKDGNEYDSISDCARKLNVNRSFVSEKNGFKIIKSITCQNKRIQGPDGTIYDNLSDCARKTGYYKTTLSRWLKNNPSKGFVFI